MGRTFFGRRLRTAGVAVGIALAALPGGALALEATGPATAGETELAFKSSLAETYDAFALASDSENIVTADTSHPFAAFGDTAHYVLAPGGDFEGDLGGWRLRGAASVVAGNQPFLASGSRSLRLAGRASATARSMEISPDFPTMRFFAVNRGDVAAHLFVDVLWQDASGKVRSHRAASFGGSGEWAALDPVSILSKVDFVDGLATVSVRFRVSNARADWRIDDVYVDPYRAR